MYRSQVEDAMLMYDKQTQRHRGTILRLVPCLSLVGVNCLFTYLVCRRNLSQNTESSFKNGEKDWRGRRQNDVVGIIFQEAQNMTSHGIYLSLN